MLAAHGAACLALVFGAHAQQATPAVERTSDLPVVHVTDRLNRLPRARSALSAFASRTTTPLRKRAYHVGERRTFSVYNHALSNGQADPAFEPVEFTLRVDDDHFRIWVETAELKNGHVRDEDLTSFETALGERTPPGSIDSTVGIIPNSVRVFGSPPDVDADGRTDVLLVDIRDGWEPGAPGGYVGGFVWAGDLGVDGNAADIVYLDTYPGLYRYGSHIGTAAVESTFAHEYQHLIHFAYDRDEHTFVNEGLSEWASLLNGYGARRMTYLSEQDEHNTPFLSWRDGPPLLYDYERAGLFAAYLEQRIGAEATGGLAREGGAAGIAAYRHALAPFSLPFDDVLADFHVANLINDGAAGPRYGYDRGQLQPLDVVPTRRFEAEAGSADLRDFPLNAGAAHYYEWTQVADLEVFLDIAKSMPASLLATMRGRVRLVAVLRRAGAGDEVRRLDGTGALAFAGAYERIVLIVIHQEPESKGVRMDLSGTWRATSDPVAIASDEVPNWGSLEQNYPNPFNSRTRVRYSLSEPCLARLTVYDALGRQVAVVVDEYRAAGTHEVVVDAAQWSVGMYVYTLEAGSHRLSRRMTFVK